MTSLFPRGLLGALGGSRGLLESFESDEVRLRDPYPPPIPPAASSPALVVLSSSGLRREAALGGGGGAAAAGAGGLGAGGLVASMAAVKAPCDE